MELDTTSRQVLNTTESVGGQIRTDRFYMLIESVYRYIISVLRRFCRAK